MSSIGPQLPAHLTKRKRSISDTASADGLPPPKSTRASNDDESDSDDGYGPSAPKVAGPTIPPSAPTTRPSMGPTMPPSQPSNPAQENDSSDSDNTGPAPPPRRTHGPAPPPAPLSERPPHPPSDSDSDSDYGPALPSTNTRGPIGPSLPPTSVTNGEPAKLQRDDWMLLPPTASAGYQERDPTKIKSRKFASGVTATTRPKDNAGGGIASIWTETPQEKAKRLADAVLGRAGASGGEGNEQQQSTGGRSTGVSGLATSGGSSSGSRDQERIRAYTEQTRGRSLVEEHQAAKKKAVARKGGEADEEDDPSKRAFDREKDMAVGGKITASQRKELLNRAADFGGRFSKGNYL